MPACSKGMLWLKFAQSAKQAIGESFCGPQIRQQARDEDPEVV